MRWRGAHASVHTWRTDIAAALAVTALGALAGALRRIPLDRCARFVDRALARPIPPPPSLPIPSPPRSADMRASSDGVLSALAFTRLPDTATTPFMRAAI